MTKNKFYFSDFTIVLNKLYQKTFISTPNGEAKAVVQDIKQYEKMQDTMAMLKLLGMSNEKSTSVNSLQ